MLFYSSGHARDAGAAAVKAGVFRKTMASVKKTNKKDESSDIEDDNDQDFTAWLYDWTSLQ